MFDPSQGIPENSIAALEACVAAQCPAEVDARLLADGRAVLFHDTRIDRMTGRAGVLGRLKGSNMQELALQGTNERIPFLADALNVVGGAVPVLVEIKCENMAFRMVTEAVLGDLSGYGGPFAVQSFNPFVLRHVRRIAPHVPLGLLSGWKFGTSIAAICQPNFLCYDVEGLENAAIVRARRKAVPVIAWTVRDQKTLRRAMQFADNYIFEGKPNEGAPELRSDRWRFKSKD